MGNRSRTTRPLTIPPDHLNETLRLAITTAWQRGWQPADLVRAAARTLDAAHSRLLGDAVLAELGRYAEVTIDPRWLPQLEDLRTGASSARTTSLERDPVSMQYAVRALADFIHMLPAIEVLGPLPGEARPPSRPGVAAPADRMLGRVRAMLAKAEATQYPAEADTFTAAAQELMARHSIDLAMLAASSPEPAEKPAGRRLGIDSPYEVAKASLLDVVSRANRCRSVWNRGHGFCTVLGHEGDLDAVETLFTSLLVQATATMNRAGTRTDAEGRSRTRAFRQSFLSAYAQRIGERLAEVTRMETEAAGARPGGDRLLPVLLSRAEAVDAAIDEMFPALASFDGGRITDAEGYYSGQAAADLAALGAGPRLE